MHASPFPRHGTTDAAGLHLRYALRSEYEPLLRAIGRETAQDRNRLAQQFILTGDVRDVLAARDSVTRLLGLRPYEP